MPVRKISSIAANGDRFAAGPPVAGPDGLRYAPDLISSAMEKGFVKTFETLAFKTFDFHGYHGNRRIVSYGYRYDYAGRTLRASDPMPDFLSPLREVASQFSGIAADKLEQALITEYPPGAGIGWHRDKPMFEDVVAFSFENPCRLRFRRKGEDGWERASLIAAPRSAYLLRGAAREQWEHSIPTVDALRYSVTFRTFKQGQKPAG